MKTLNKVTPPTNKILAKFSYPQKSQNKKFQPPQKILRSSPSLEIRSSPPPPNWVKTPLFAVDKKFKSPVSHPLPLQ